MKPTNENYKERRAKLLQMIDERVDEIELKDGSLYYRDEYILRTEEVTSGGYTRRHTGRINLSFYRGRYNNDKKMYEKKVNIFSKIDEIVENVESSLEYVDHEIEYEKKAEVRRNRDEEIIEQIRDAGFPDYMIGDKEKNIAIRSGGSYGSGFKIKDQSFDVDESADMNEVLAKLDEISKLYGELKEAVRGSKENN